MRLNREREPSQQEEAERPGTRAGADEFTFTQILALQRSAGNAAVARALAGPERRGRAAARDADAMENQPAGATLQRYFQFNGKEVTSKVKVPTIHGASATDLQKLADDKTNDYGPITDAASVTAAMLKYQANNRVVEQVLPLDEDFAGNQTVWNNNAFAVHAKQPVRATFQLDWNQGKHDTGFKPPDGNVRHKTGGAKMPPGSDYATLAQGVPAALAKARLTQIFAKAPREPFDFRVQKNVQADGLQYEISAQWAPLETGRHVLVYYHCYPPR